MGKLYISYDWLVGYCLKPGMDLFTLQAHSGWV